MNTSWIISRTLLTICLALLFNYIANVLSNVVYGHFGLFAFDPMNIVGGNMYFYGLPFSLSLLFLAVVDCGIKSFGMRYVFRGSIAGYSFSLILIASALYAVLTTPFVYATQGIYGLGMYTISLLSMLVR
ncbi:MAG: hypothetical protein RI911_580 [Candidatus Parcubacteria bacterium]|jgi:hypothetical protein